ncbi:MAG: hypothetical protein H6714_06420 [Myxococcales bacterium]|nr:hypothetical protein [Myxococcales bacterium]
MRLWQDAFTFGSMPNYAPMIAVAFMGGVGISKAHAFDVHLDSDTAFQSYEVRSPRGGAFLTRSRLLQNVAFRVVEPLSDDLKEGPQLSTVVQLRLDHDFGESCLVGSSLCVVASDASAPGGYQPLFDPSVVDAPTAYVEIDAPAYRLRMRIGRQTLWDALEIRRMDGAHARMGMADWMAAEGYFGQMVRGNSVLGSETFAPEGRPRRDLDDIDPTLVAYLDNVGTTWMAGGALEVGEPRLMKMRLSMQELWEAPGAVSRRLGMAVSSQPVEGLNLSAMSGWDLLDGTWFRARGQAQLNLTGWGLQAELERRVPRFDWGSIWAFFEVAPIEEARLGGYWEQSPALRLSAAVRGRMSHLPESTDRDVGLEAGANVKAGRLRLDVHTFGWIGDMGPVSGAMLDVSHPLAHRFFVYVRSSVWYFDDPYRDVLEGVSLSEMLGTRWRITPQSSVVMELSHATNRVVGHRWRALAMLNIEAWR